MGNYFWGRYFKCQSDNHTLAVIPAIHKTSGGKSCSVQLITDSGSWNTGFSGKEFQKNRKHIIIEKNHFDSTGLHLDLHTPQCTAYGMLSFGGLSPIKYDIMGPFRYVPFMECRHSVVSMRHSVNGMLTINGSVYSFDNSIGYIEGDSGHSFPKEYAWTQCFFENGSLMLSVAQIPMGKFTFTGIICVIQWQGCEYRLATYSGAKALLIKNGEIIIRQGGDVLTVRLPKKASQELRSPINGAMTGIIRESIVCRASYRFQRNSRTLFDFETDKASFEYEYGE